MSKNNIFERKMGRRRFVGGAATMAGALVLEACSNESASTSPAQAQSPLERAQPTVAPTEAAPVLYDLATIEDNRDFTGRISSNELQEIADNGSPEDLVEVFSLKESDITTPDQITPETFMRLVGFFNSGSTVVEMEQSLREARASGQDPLLYHATKMSNKYAPAWLRAFRNERSMTLYSDEGVMKGHYDTLEIYGALHQYTAMRFMSDALNKGVLGEGVDIDIITNEVVHNRGDQLVWSDIKIKGFGGSTEGQTSFRASLDDTSGYFSTPMNVGPDHGRVFQSFSNQLRDNLRPLNS